MHKIGNRPVFFNQIPTMSSSQQNKKTFNFNSENMKRYFSSLDMEIFFGDNYIDEIVDLRYSVKQNILPLFGYNSYTYDEMAIGNRIIQGSFTVNFTKPGFLLEVLEKMKEEDIERELAQVQKINATIENMQDEVIASSQDGYTSEGIIASSENLVSYEKILSKRALWDKTFDIDMMYGKNDKKYKPDHTILTGVAIMDCSQELGISGAPILETYTFLARDIVTR